MKTAFIFFLFLISSSAFAQKGKDAETLIREVFPEGEEADPEFLENLIHFFYNPLDLNKADATDLQSLMILTPMQITEFLNYRSETGELLSIYELQVIPGFDLSTIEQLLPFVKINSFQESISSLVKRFIHNKNKYLLQRYERRAGVNKNENYVGDNHKLLLSLRNSRQHDFSAGLILEKDAGEAINWNASQKYFITDYHSMHLAVYNKKFIRSFIAGDYHLQFGQGLVLGSGFSPGKGSETILTLKKAERGVTPHFSSMEYSFMRGLALSVKANDFIMTAFYSSQSIDGNISDDTGFTRVYTGYHRSNNELSKRKTVKENIYGGNISFNPASDFHAGLTGAFTRYDIPVIRNKNLYHIYDFSGRTNFALGTDLSYQWRNFNLFGEYGLSANKSSGLILGATASLSKALDVAILSRNYEKDFHSFYSNAFSEDGNAQNEKGIYFGLKVRSGKKILATAYADLFNFPWLKYQISAPSEGEEYFGKFSYSFSKTSLIYIQGRIEKKEKDISGESAIKNLKSVIRKSFIIHAETSAGLLSFRTKIMYMAYRHENSYSGFTILQDLEYDTRKAVITARFALFDAENFNTRMYIYERDVLYSFSLPFYYGRGMRKYLMLRYKLRNNLDIWVRISATHFLYTDMVDPGRERVDLKVQTRLVF